MSKLNTTAIDIRDFIEAYVSNGTYEFYPFAISKANDIPIDEIFDELIKLCLDGLLELQIERRYPHCAVIIDTIADWTKYENKTLMYPYCHKEHIVSTNTMYPVFYASDAYKEYVKRKQGEQK